MKSLVSGAIRFGESRAGRLSVFLCLLVCASNLAQTPAGTAALAAALVLAYCSPTNALAVLFGGCFLGYVWGVPVTAGYVVICALLPVLIKNLRSTLDSVPPAAAALSACVLLLCFATYPFQKSVDLVYLGFGLAAFWIAASYARRIGKEKILGAFALSFASTLFIPFLCNMVLLLRSPFFQPLHLKSLVTERITVGVIEPNVVAAYLAAALAVGLFSANLHSKSARYIVAHVFVMALTVVALTATGSRITLLIGLATIAVAYLAAAFLVISKRRSWFCAKSVRVVSLGLISCLAFAAAAAFATGKIKTGAIERLASTNSIEDTGRPKTLRDSIDRLDEVPYTGMHVDDYVLRTARHSPHSSVVSSAMFLGIWVAVLLFALILVPVCDALLSMRLSGAPEISVAILVLFLAMQAIPAPSERGLLALVGVWYATCKLQRGERCIPNAVYGGAPA